MTEVGGLQEHVTRNVRVLMAIGEIRTQVQLAAALGLDRTTLAGRFSGKAGWKLEELADLGRVFNVTPASLLGDTAQLVGAVGPAKAAGGPGVSSPTGPYVRRNLISVGEFAHVIDLIPRIARRANVRLGVAQSDAPTQAMVRRVG